MCLKSLRGLRGYSGSLVGRAPAWHAQSPAPRKLDVVVSTYNPSTPEAEVGRSETQSYVLHSILGQPELQDTLSQKVNFMRPSAQKVKAFVAKNLMT